MENRINKFKPGVLVKLRKNEYRYKEGCVVLRNSKNNKPRLYYHYDVPLLYLRVGNFIPSGRTVTIIQFYFLWENEIYYMVRRCPYKNLQKIFEHNCNNCKCVSDFFEHVFEVMDIKYLSIK